MCIFRFDIPRYTRVYPSSSVQFRALESIHVWDIQELLWFPDCQDTVHGITTVFHSFRFTVV